VIVVYGGSQIDAADRTQPRFPERNVEAVTQRVRALLREWRPRFVLGAAASGADLVVLEAARAEGIDARVVLAAPVPRFLETSVASRGEAWVQRFRELVDPDGVEVLAEVEDDGIYQRANETMLHRAAELAEPGEEIVVLVVRPPEGGEPSVSDDLAHRAQRHAYRVHDVDPSTAG
jgi:hypothetical protein